MAGIAVSTLDRSGPVGPRHPLTIVLDRLRSAFNVGNVFRLAEVVRAAGIVTCGYTATPPHPKLARTARGCDELVRCTHAPDALTAVRNLQAAGNWVVAVETAPQAPTVWDLDWRFPVALMFGNEALGIDPEALAAADAICRLPVYGTKNSLNVGNCAAVVVYAALRAYRQQQGEEHGLE